MHIKEIKLLARDLLFFATGTADVAPADLSVDEWLYPLDWTYQLDREKDYFEPKDSVGIPLLTFRGTLGDQYLISRITGYALAHWNRWRMTGDSLNREGFLRTVEHFPVASAGRHAHNFPHAGMPTGWISCISQGEAASVFARAYVATGRREHIERALEAITPLTIPVDGGGLQSRLPDGRPFLEEYPGTIYRHVLNGCLYALLGIHDVIRASPEPKQEHQLLFRALVDSVGQNLPAWDIDGWSTYDYPFDTQPVRNANTMTYQVLQGTLLNYLGSVSGDKRLRAAGQRWLANSRRLPFRLRALRDKLRYRFAFKW
jgi:heparosan-N-sulfate-glucuronate 5-epimerase